MLFTDATGKEVRLNDIVRLVGNLIDTKFKVVMIDGKGIVIGKSVLKNYYVNLNQHKVLIVGNINDNPEIEY